MVEIPPGGSYHSRDAEAGTAEIGAAEVGATKVSAVEVGVDDASFT